jgi:hypothetical protein
MVHRTLCGRLALVGSDGLYFDVLDPDGIVRGVENAGNTDLITFEARGPALIVKLIPDSVRFIAQDEFASVLPYGSAERAQLWAS